MNDYLLTKKPSQKPRIPGEELHRWGISGRSTEIREDALRSIGNIDLYYSQYPWLHSGSSALRETPSTWEKESITRVPDFTWTPKWAWTHHLTSYPGIYQHTTLLNLNDALKRTCWKGLSKKLTYSSFQEKYRPWRELLSIWMVFL